VLRVVQALEDFSGKRTANGFERVSVPSAIRNTLDLLRPGLESSASVVVQLEPLPPVWAVARDVHALLLALLRNALEAVADVPDGLVTVSARAQGDAVEIAVEDNGPGIAPEVQERMYDPFFTTRKTYAACEGLGLTTALSIVAKHQGRLDYEPSPRTGGARFVVRLPTGPEGARPTP
jgi:two-component system sensor histidine kinase HupT/HoxJ